MIKKVGKAFLCIFAVIIAIFALIAIWWILESQPLNVRQVHRMLNRYTLSQQFTHTATRQERCPQNRRINTYYFEDSDGVAFTVESRVVNWHYFEPRRLPPTSDYLLALARANQEHIIDSLGKTGLAVQFIDDGGSGIDSVRFIILVHSYDDLEFAAEAIESTVDSLGRILVQDSQSGMSFIYPRISVHHDNNTSLKTFRFWHIDAMQLQGVFPGLHANYLDRIRWGLIDEELPYEIWWRYPRHLFYIYFDGEQIRGAQSRVNTAMSSFRYNAELEEYTIWLFGNFSVLTWYVDKMGGSYDFGELEATWTIGADTWVATLYRETIVFTDYDRPSPGLISSSVTRIEQITKNGESLGVYRTHMTLPVLARMLDITFEIDQTASAVYLWS